MNRNFALMLGIVSCLLIAACDNDDTLPLSQYEKVDVNVYFYFPDNKEVFLGTTRGASSCGSMSHAYAASKGLSRSDRWSYICCVIRKGSQCYNKIR
jgi:hypothetical protein